MPPESSKGSPGSSDAHLTIGSDTQDISNLPTTPERKKQGSGVSKVPQTPPNQSFNRFMTQDTPTQPNDDFLPPVTPSANISNSQTRFDKLSNVPQTPFSMETTDTSNGDASPLKSPSQSRPEKDDDKPPIRQISSALKTRLSYAFVKVQNGWTNQSLDELEKTIDVSDTSRNISEKLLLSPSKNKSPLKITKPSKLLQRSMKVDQPPQLSRLDHRLRFGADNESLLDKGEDNENIGINGDDGSANNAFLQAISKSRSPKKRFLNKNGDKALNVEPLKGFTPEEDAIQTLMSLSSPQSFKSKVELPQNELPSARLSFGDSLSPEKPSTTSCQESNDDETDIETDAETDEEEENRSSGYRSQEH